MVHDAAVLGLQVDTARLFYGDDHLYEVWLDGVCDRIYATKKRWDKKQAQAMKTG